jgi:hypothetical protein
VVGSERLHDFVNDNPFVESHPAITPTIRYGAVNLFGLSLRQRAEALISIAHPDFRAGLRHEFAATRHMALPS